MPKYNYNPARMPGIEPRIVAGAWACNAGSDPIVASGIGYTVARTGTGEHTVTMESSLGTPLAFIPSTEYSGAAGEGVVDVELVSVGHGGATATTVTTSGGTAFDFGDDVVVNFVHFANATRPL